MRTTISLDDDVTAIIEAERRKAGETFRETVNRLIRVSQQQSVEGPELPLLPGRLLVDVSDVSEVLAMLDDEIPPQ